MKSRRLRFVLAVIALTGVIWGLAMVPAPRDGLAAREGPGLEEAKAWGYQLTGVDAGRIPDAVDILVIDYSRDGSARQAFTPADIEALRTRRDGSRRIVLSYLSVGEAERYRYYWWHHWSVLRPGWLGSENKSWKGNYPVRYWDSDWQRIIMDAGTPSWLGRLGEAALEWRKPYLDRILEAGFDGVYLDRVDGFGDWASERPTGLLDMAAFVGRLAAYAKARKPGFLIVPQNGEELLRLDDYVAAIDAIAKEDLRFGVNGAEQPNDTDDIKRSSELLDRLKAAGKPVLVVEYLEDPMKRAMSLVEARRRGYLMLFARRELDKPPQAFPADTSDGNPVPPAANGSVDSGGESGEGNGEGEGQEGQEGRADQTPSETGEEGEAQPAEPDKAEH